MGAKLKVTLCLWMSNVYSMPPIINSGIFKKCIVLISLFLSISVHAFPTSEIRQDELLGGLQQNITQSIASLTEEIKRCKKIEAGIVPVIDRGNKVFIKGKSSYRNDILTGLAHLSFRNMFKCVSETRMELAFNLGTLRTARNHYKLDNRDIFEVESSLVYPSVKEIKLAVNYSRLSPGLRIYLEALVGNTPFDLLATIISNKLTTETLPLSRAID